LQRRRDDSPEHDSMSLTGGHHLQPEGTTMAHQGVETASLGLTIREHLDS
jgi:hypothetical protein